MTRTSYDALMGALANEIWIVRYLVKGEFGNGGTTRFKQGLKGNTPTVGKGSIGSSDTHTYYCNSGNLSSETCEPSAIYYQNHTSC
jgi:hypothetical protein